MQIFKGKRKRLKAKHRKGKFIKIGPKNAKLLEQQEFIHKILQSKDAQAKLTIGQPNDSYEKEADHVADKVVSMPDPSVQRETENEEQEETVQTKSLANQITPLIQRQEAAEEEEEETAQAKMESVFLQRQEAPEEEEETAQAKLEQNSLQRQEVAEEEKEEETAQTKGAPHKSIVAHETASAIHSLKGSGNHLPHSERSYYEPRFGTDFSQVRVHNDNRANMLARKIYARAFTLGNDIVFASGEYQPHTEAGQRLIAHELTHTIQQGKSDKNK